MWQLVIHYLPEWIVIVQGLIALLIPLLISRLFNWFHTQKED
jgi:hypothetical protein